MKRGEYTYISGPMTGKRNLNYQAFAKCEKELLEMDFKPLNPHKIHHSTGPNQTREDYMLLDIQQMLEHCEDIVLLKGWEKSWGCKVEIVTAHACGLKIYHSGTLREFDYELIKEFFQYEVR